MLQLVLELQVSKQMHNNLYVLVTRIIHHSWKLSMRNNVQNESKFELGLYLVWFFNFDLFEIVSISSVCILIGLVFLEAIKLNPLKHAFNSLY